MVVDGLIPSKNITCIYFFHHILQVICDAVCQNGVTMLFELGQVVDHFTAEKLTAMG